MNIRCCDFSPCDDVTIPTTNYSAEAPDVNLAIGYNFGIPGFVPPLNSPFTATGCVAVCEEPTQVLADQCAERQWIECLVTPAPTNPTVPPWTQTSPPGSPGAPLNVFGNTEQNCTGSCPDGTPFTFTVPAGTYFAFTQAEADDMAQSYACTQLPSNLICLSEVGGEVCLGSFFNFSGSVSGTGPFEIVLASGSLPPGVSLVQTGNSTFSIVGTPTTIGAFTFTVEAIDPNDEFVDKTYIISVVGIGTASLPSGTATNPYDFIIATAGPVTGTVTWSIVSGSLPAGLSLNSATGEITGTPSTAGTSHFTVQMSDAAVSCQKAFSIVVGSPVSPCMLALGGNWTVDFANSNPPQTLLPTDIQGSFPDVTGNFPVSNACSIHKFITNNTGSPFTIHVAITWNATDPPVPYLDNGTGQIAVEVNLVSVLQLTWDGFHLVGSGSTDIVVANGSTIRLDLAIGPGIHALQNGVGPGQWSAAFSTTIELSCS